MSHALAPLPTGNRSRIVQRAQHAGHVPQRIVFCTSRREWAHRLTLEIDDAGVLIVHQDLTQVIIAVMTGLAQAAARQ